MPTTTTPSPNAAPVVSQGFMARMSGRFAVLNGAQRELWLVFAIKFLMVAAYGITNSTLKLWLSSDFGYSDKESLALVATWSLMYTVFTLLVGSLTDAIGLRRTFFIGVWVCILTRAVMGLVTVKWIALAFGLFPLAFGEALSTPVLVAAVRTYSNTRQRSISFSLFYMMMNVGFLIAGFLFDHVRKGLGEYGKFHFLGMEISTYRTLFLVGLVLECSVLPLIYFLRNGAEATDEGVVIAPQKRKYPGATMWNSFRLTVRDAIFDTARLFAGLLRQQGFYRLLGFLILIAFIKLIVMQMYYVFPTFGIRELGPGAPVGQLWNVNSIIIIAIVPFIGAMTQRFPAYGMVILGGAICAASVFIMALPTNWFEHMAAGWPGHLIAHTYLGLQGAVHPYYVMIVLFVAVFSLGEAFYSPRVYEYAAAIAPKGQEASYGALSYVPFLLAKLLIGTFSGFLLAKYCPEQGERHSGTMWLAIAITASIAPIGLLALRKYLRVHEVGRGAGS
jgi:MFS family permease